MEILNRSYKITHLFLILSSISVFPVLTQKLTVKNLNDPSLPLNLTSADVDYQNENLDVIWNISYPAEITFFKFDIDSQAGDFIVVCEYPLPDGDKFSDGAPAEEVIHELPLERSILLTTKPLNEDKEGNQKLVIHVRSEYGGFIYFHGTKPNPTGNGIQKDADLKNNGTGVSKKAEILAENTFEGFLVEIKYLDLNPLPPTTTTTEKLTTPAAGIDVYLWKHVIGKTPDEFYRNLKPFKQMIAAMGNQFCEMENIELARPIQSNDLVDDVRLDNTTIMFCDRQIKYYEVCVQIKLAIIIRDIQGKYVMTTPVMEVMWNTLASGRLVTMSMQSFEPEPEKPSVTWVWIASFLGVVLTFATILCFVFSGGMIRRTHMPVKQSPGIPQERSIENSYPDDKDNPLVDIVQTLFSRKHNDDGELMGMRDGGLSNNSSLSIHKTNPLHLKTFDNPAFVNDEFRGSFRTSSYYPSRPPGSGSSGQGHHTFQVQVHTPPTNNDSDSDAEMEIYNIAPGVNF